jgi:hypothetical protein
MRPSRTILLVGENEDTLSPLRYVISNSQPEALDKVGRCYRVFSANSEKEAVEYLYESEFSLMLCQCPCASLESLLTRAKKIRPFMPTVVIYDKSPCVESGFADAMLYKPTTAGLLDRIRVMVQRRRGPRKGWEKGVAPERPVVQEMEVVA